MALSADPTIHRQVVTAARTLLGQDAGAPIARIAREAGVSRATLYRHFGSRDALLQAVEMEPPTPARERVLAAAAELIGQGGLHAFSMEQLATAAGVSRATVYRLFPTKAALFGEVVRHFSPFQPLVTLLAEHGDRPPDEVIPRITHLFAAVGAARIGIMRGVLLEALSVRPDAVRGIQPFMPEALAALGGYLVRNMQAGLIRPMHPLLAVQAVLGPIAFHLLSRRLAERVVGFDVPIQEVVDQLTASILGGLTA
ncbi:MAG: TetR/AcrR family transcriptional regulator [Candidatus Limnocylindria bacterium]